MRIFLDTANIEHIEHGVSLGVVSGVTTNPTLVSMEGHKDYRAMVKKICSIVPGPVSAEVVVEGAPAMLEQAREIAAWATNVVIKIPATAEGLEVTSALKKENIKVNMTLCFSVNQALLAALAGASYISPFVGRLDDAGHDGMALVKDIVDVFKNYQDLTTEVLAASIRHPLHCIAAARAGAHIATVPYKVLLQMIKHPLTDIGIERFLADWKSVSGK
ncbi:MAG TPA: fructose-6-phosphate aldolase [Dehalococcoidia bacterium]|nr:fructose-6-phosphate aldolase [Dehalococcoidia bacterium]